MGTVEDVVVAGVVTGDADVDAAVVDAGGEVVERVGTVVDAAVADGALTVVEVAALRAPPHAANSPIAITTATARRAGDLGRDEWERWAVGSVWALCSRVETSPRRPLICRLEIGRAHV